MSYRIAIVEDNATARANLRSLLLPMGELEISSFASGQELKLALRKQNFELILFDFHLGQQKNGVEWVQHLRHSQFIKPSTGIGFITSDGVPQTIGQIVDVQPDLLIIKPYTGATLKRNLQHYLTYRRLVQPVLADMDQHAYEQALQSLDNLKTRSLPAKVINDITKLEARLLLKLGKVSRARVLFDNVLLHSDRILWAQWGRIKCQYLQGNWHDCQSQLSAMLSTSLARDKAFEWLACLCFEQQAYSQAEYYLDRIKVSELSGAATRLKSLTYHKQDRVLESIELLEKKRDFNRSARERFNEFTFELAEFYLLIAEQQPNSNREESLSQARRLIGLAGRNQADSQLVQKRDFLLAYSAILDDDTEKARQLLGDDGLLHFERTEPGTLITAAKVFAALDQPDQARHLLSLAQQRNQSDLNVAQQMSLSARLLDSQQQLGLASEQALELNKQGTRLFVKQAFAPAMEAFYQAFRMMPQTAAYGLNLLQSMVEDGRAVFRSMSCEALLSKLPHLKMNDVNKKRLKRLQQAIQAAPEVYLPEPLPTADPVATAEAAAEMQTDAQPEVRVRTA